MLNAEMPIYPSMSSILAPGGTFISRTRPSIASGPSCMSGRVTSFAFIAHKTFTALPKPSIVLRLENFPTTEAAQKSATPASAVVEAVGRVWLLTLGSQGERSKAGSFVTEIGPLPDIPVAASYELQVADADFGPAMNPAISKAVHTHSGPEIWYVLTGAQCLETRNGIQHAKAGEGMFAPANTPMQLNIAGTGNRQGFLYNRSRCYKTRDHGIRLAAER